jgi:hypothetical protein
MLANDKRNVTATEGIELEILSDSRDLFGG